MAPLLPNNTARFRINYAAGIGGHSTQVRWGGSPAALGAAFTGILTGLEPVLYLNTVSTVEFAPAGSDIFNLVTTGLEGLVFGSTGIPTERVATFVNFIGRTPGGRRVRMAFFGVKSLGTDYRYAPGEIAAIDSTIAVLNDPGQPFLGIDGLRPIWKTYANAGVNTHWQKALRPG